MSQLLLSDLLNVHQKGHISNTLFERWSKNTFRISDIELRKDEDKGLMISPHPSLLTASGFVCNFAMTRCRDNSAGQPNWTRRRTRSQSEAQGCAESQGGAEIAEFL